MLNNRHLRNLLASVLGGCAGLSFTISVLPVMLQLGNIGGQLELTRLLVPLWPWAALLWAAGGLSAVRVGTPLPAALVLGLVGAASGALLVGLGPGMAPLPAVIGVVSGAVYGGLGGLILGRVLTSSDGRSAS
jgi:hypothetical protein